MPPRANDLAASATSSLCVIDEDVGGNDAPPPARTDGVTCHLSVERQSKGKKGEEDGDDERSVDASTKLMARRRGLVSLE